MLGLNMLKNFRLRQQKLLVSLENVLYNPEAVAGGVL